jgi:hypothetical protein
MAAIITPEVSAPLPLDPDRKNPEATDAPRDGGPVPYIQRKIDVTFSLGTGDFGEAGQNLVTLRGYRCYVTVAKAAADAATTLSLRIWGMKFSQMQQLSTYGRKYEATRDNKIRIDAGDDVSGMKLVFNGTLLDAYFDGNSQPDVAFQVSASEAYVSAIKPAPPISIAGAVDVSTTLKGLAAQMGVTFEDHGVDAKLRDVYYPGTALQQARRIVEHSGINWNGIENGTLAIWPRGQGREVGTIPLITPLSGLKDYPTFNQMGVIVSCLFRPINIGQRVIVRSSLWDNNPGAQAQIWRVDPHGERSFYPYTYTYILESEAPNGPWFTTFMATTVPMYSGK